MFTLDILLTVMAGTGYRVTSARSHDGFAFEDDSLLGFISFFSSPTALIESWRQSEYNWLTAYATPLHEAAGKAWNTYSIFLTSGVPTEEQSHQLFRIEDDMHYTRKIARASVTTQEDLRTALAPLLPVVVPRLPHTDSLEARFRALAHEDFGPDISQMLFGGSTADDIAQLLVDGS